jgi:hypothetical protein
MYNLIVFFIENFKLGLYITAMEFFKYTIVSSEIGKIFGLNVLLLSRVDVPAR